MLPVNASRIAASSVTVFIVIEAAAAVQEVRNPEAAHPTRRHPATAPNIAGDQFRQTELVYAILGPMASGGPGGLPCPELWIMSNLVYLLLFSCLAAFVAGVVIAAAALFI